VEFVEVLVFETALVGALLGFKECFLNCTGRRRGLFGNDLMGAEDVVPG
jgi:hypothetical protein